MDFTNRNGQQSQAGRAPMPGQTVQAAPQMPQQSGGKGQHEKRHYSFSNLPTWLRVANVVLLFSITVLAVSLVLLFRNTNPNEGKYVSSANYQAVFLNNGQVYFGKVQAVTAKYIDLQDIFYLNSQNQSNGTQSASSTTSNNFTLIKLGCELHGPYDQMIINRDQVTFWENLRDDGQVVKTIKTWVQQNPNGQKCSTSSSSTSQSSTGTGTGTSTTGTGTTSTTGTGTGTTSTGTTTGTTKN